MTRGNFFKFNLKIYAYVYEQLLIFLPSEVKYETITTNQFFLHVHQLIRGKVHLHHPHITGNIIGYVHDFCNMAFIEKCTSEISFLAHNFFGLDLFYFGNNLTHANYGDIRSEIKLIDSLKFYQQSLRELSSTLTPEEKTAVKNLAEKFLNERYYFSTVWAYLSVNKKNKILEIIAEGKGVTPYGIIVDMDSFFIKPDKEFWEKNKFFSKLK